MARRSIVFGGSGFIGTHLLRRLVGNGEDRPISVDIRAAVTPVSGVEYTQGDVRDLSGIELNCSHPRIYNLAAVHTTPGHKDFEYYETNVLGATEVTRLARRVSAQEIVFTSSISVYGPSEAMMDESAPLSPLSAYGRSKAMAERIHHSWLEEEADRRLVIVRPGAIFGPGEGGNFTRMAKLLRKGVFVYPGRRDAIKACFYVDDLLDAIEFARTKSERLVLFNGCYPDRYTLEDIVEAFRAHHFPRARTFAVPQAAVIMAAIILGPFASFGLGIHPDRVRKLTHSTNVLPGWLIRHEYARSGSIETALDRWARQSEDAFV